MASKKGRKHSRKRGRPRKNSARDSINKAVKLLQQAKKKIHVKKK